MAVLGVLRAIELLLGVALRGTNVCRQYFGQLLPAVRAGGQRADLP
ncbi:MAG: hypothetical protein ACLUVV_05140 [Christensenellales bacterium]